MKRVRKMGIYKLVKEKDTTTRNHSAEYSIKNYLTKDFNKNFSLAVSKLENSEHESTKSIASDRIYYFIDAKATFTINNETIEIGSGDVLFIEKDTFYSFKGNFKAVLINMPAFGVEKDVNVS
jgi:mannose-6-phosphate isomerase class I